MIRKAQSVLEDARNAVRELHAGLWHEQVELVLFFCSADYDLDALADEINRCFTGIHIIGCTTAGEIGPLGFRTRSISGVSFGSDSCTAVSGRLDALQTLDPAQGSAFVQSLLQNLERRAADVNPRNTFAFMLIDGLSAREEFTAHTLQQALGSIATFGGSAGDGLRFRKTHIFQGGQFRSNAAAVAVVNTQLPFRVFKTQHFVRRKERLVVTGADSARRLVTEINGLPAAREYARTVGADVFNLCPSRFAAHPVVVMIDGTDYVRSIQKVGADGSLTFYCAIDEGLVLRAADGVDLVSNLESTFHTLREQIGPPQVVIACDCTLRNVEIDERGLRSQVDEIMRRYGTVGFGTYGEQYGGVHVNQTLTGIAIGERGDV